MLLFNEPVFDDMIKETTLTWYSSEALNERMGAAEVLTIQACTTGVAAGSTLTVAVETSADDKNWIEHDGTPQINGQSIANDGTYVARALGGNLLSFTRLRITLGGSAECRLKLYVSARVLAGQRTGRSTT